MPGDRQTDKYLSVNSKGKLGTFQNRDGKIRLTFKPKYEVAGEEEKEFVQIWERIISVPGEGCF